MKITIGVIQKPFGIKGEVKIKPMTDFVEERYKKGNKITLVLGNQNSEYEIQSVRHHQGSLLVKFKELDTLNDVEKFHQGLIQIDRDTMHDLPKDEYYFIDLVGCNVFNKETCLGEVTEVMDMPAHPVLRIKTDDEDILIPFVEQFIDDVSLEEKAIWIKYMEGLF